MSNYQVDKELARGAIVVQSPDLETNCVANPCRDRIWMKFDSGQVSTGGIDTTRTGLAKIRSPVVEL